MTKIQASIKQGEIDEGLFLVTSNKVLLQTIKSALVKYQAVKKEGFNRRSCRDYTKKSKGYFT
jgi:biopolymer transport protein ExbB